MRNLSALSASVSRLSFNRTGGSSYEVLLDLKVVLDEEDARKIGFALPSGGDPDREAHPRPKSLEFQGPKRAARMTLGRDRGDREVLLESGVGISKVTLRRFGRDGDRVALVFRAVSSVDTRLEVLAVIDSLLDGGEVLLDLVWSFGDAGQPDLFDSAGKRNPLFFSRGSQSDLDSAVLFARTIFPAVAFPWVQSGNPKIGDLLAAGHDVRVAGETDTALDASALPGDTVLEIHRPGRAVVQATKSQAREALESFARRLRAARPDDCDDDAGCTDDAGGDGDSLPDDDLPVDGPPESSVSSGNPDLDEEAREFLDGLEEPDDDDEGEPSSPAGKNVVNLATRKAAGKA